MVAGLPATCLLFFITISNEYAILFNVSVNKFRYNNVCISPINVFNAAYPMLNPYPIFVLLVVYIVFHIWAAHKLTFIIIVVFEEWFDPKLCRVNYSTNHTEKYPNLRYIIVFDVNYNWISLPINRVANIFIIDVELCQPRHKIK